MVLLEEREKDKPSPAPSPFPFTPLNFLLFSPPQHNFCPFLSISNSSNNSNSNSTLSPSSNPNSINFLSFIFAPWETMRRRPRTTFLLFLLIILLFAVFSLHLSRYAVSGWRPDSDLYTKFRSTHVVVRDSDNSNIANEFTHQTRRVSSINFKRPISSVSVLLPDWEILVIVSPDTLLPFSPADSGDQHQCLFRNNAKSPANYSGILPFTNRTTFKCDMPESVRRRRMFSQPMLVTGTSENESPDPSQAPELLRWNFLAYESFSTEDDVVVFAKGVNHRQGYDRSPKELRCVFGLKDGGRDAVRTLVTSSVQEVFRCAHPDPSELGLGSEFELSEGEERIVVVVSLEIVEENLVVPTVAYYMPRPKPVAVQDSGFEAQARPKHFLCACTMVYNVAKFLREWVMYHSKIGVENFILYDNGSDDDLQSVIEKLRAEGYNISTLPWIWPKTQEAGFSHSILYSKSKGLCSWMMYVDVDEFVFSPLWGDGNGNGRGNGSHSKSNDHDRNHEFHSLKSLLPPQDGRGRGRSRIGQVSIRCNEFGPSGQRWHPAEGVTQGYTCRRRVEQRHKSMVLVDAVDRSLWNVIHHFQVKEEEGFRSKQLSMEEAVVNHYKYQAWEEFKTKFRRRVSAYVVDWRQAVNPKSKDRTPGLGFEPIEPKDWAHSFCEVRDHRLQSLTRAWFGSFAPNGYRMAWQTR